jgi:hypothetical protein
MGDDAGALNRLRDVARTRANCRRAVMEIKAWPSARFVCPRWASTPPSRVLSVTVDALHDQLSPNMTTVSNAHLYELAPVDAS